MKKKPLSPLLLMGLFLNPAPAAAGLFPDSSFSDSARGTTSAQFLKVPASARLAAMGGAGLALYGPDAYFLNPAGLAALAPRESSLQASYESLLGAASRTGLSYSRGAGASVFSAGLIYQDSGAGLQTLDAAGRVAGGGIAAYDMAAGAGWAGRFSRVDAGLNLKYISSRLAETSGRTAALDAGLTFRAGPDSATDFAIAVRNLGAPLKLGSASAPLPFEAGGGLRWRRTPELDILLEGRLPCDHAPYVILAGEWHTAGEHPAFFARAGLNSRNYDDHGFMGSFAGGFGLKLGGFSIDYAFTPYGELGAAHRFTAGLAWGAPPPVKRPKVVGLSGYATIAVAPFTPGLGVTESEAEVIRGLVESELAKTGKFIIADRFGTDFVLKEKKLAASGLSGQEVAASLGKLHGARLAAFGMLYKTSDGYLINVRVIDAASGELIRSESARAADRYLFPEASRSLAAALAFQ